MRHASLAAIALAALVAGCGTSPLDRGISGAGLGAGAGLVGAALLDGNLAGGAALGAAAGGAVGVLTNSDGVYLGEPVWR